MVAIIGRRIAIQWPAKRRCQRAGDLHVAEAVWRFAVSDVKRLRQLEAENAAEKLVAERDAVE
jgi:hypothetical protein